MRLLQVCVVWGVVAALVCVLGLMVFGYCAGVCCDWFVWVCLGFRLLLGVVVLLFVLYCVSLFGLCFAWGCVCLVCICRLFASVGVVCRLFGCLFGVAGLLLALIVLCGSYRFTVAGGFL